MKRLINAALILSIIFLASTICFASEVICFDDNNSYLIQAPEGWEADFDAAEKLGLCVIYVLEGTTFSDSPAVIYPRLIETRESGEKAILQIISRDTQQLRMHGAKNFSVTKEPKEKNAQGLEFLFRYFANGPAPNEFEAVSYHAGNEAVLLSVLSTRSKSAFDSYKAKLREFVMQIRPVSKEELEIYKY